MEKSQTMHEFLLAMPDQCLDAWQQAKTVKLPPAYKKCRQVILAGMGGSNLGLRLIRAVYKTQLPFPLELVNHYQLPAYADRQTLVIASSYSGLTEETLMVAQQAHKKGCQVVVMSTGGRLAEWAQHYQLPTFQFTPTHNPSNQPRNGIGYMLFTMLAIFKQLGLAITDREVVGITKHLKNLAEDWAEEVPALTNRAKHIANELYGFAPLYIASEHLHGNGRTAANQTNENAKSFAATAALPELNHHLMEGLKNPSTLTRGLKAVAFRSDRYAKRLQKRYDITRSVVERQGLSWIEYRPSAKTKLGEVCEVLLLTSFMTFYLSALYQENPLAIPWVDFFKKELAKT
ncbi:MAG: hypothetical protein HY461_01450 [Parcubacteria group bacterium]|nr:hypothetical protein [Parcubacteria group bacterium]